MSVRMPGDPAELRRARGAFFTPEPIAAHLAAWAVRSDPQAKILDPTCGEAVFLQAAGRELKAAGCQSSDLDQRLYGVDLHAESLASATALLESEGLDAHLLVDDFFAIATPDQLGSPLPYMDAVVGNPPFVRYQQHIGATRRRSVSAALRQGVRLNGLASSWAALLVHACGFLKPDGRLAMVLPAELLTVSYAEPVRAWLRQRFEKVHLVLFERLQFEDALEKVVLVLAEGSGGCDAFSLYHVEDATDLSSIKPYGNWSVTPSAEGKWTDLLLPHGSGSSSSGWWPNTSSPCPSTGQQSWGSSPAPTLSSPCRSPHVCASGCRRTSLCGSVRPAPGTSRERHSVGSSGPLSGRRASASGC